MLAEQTAQSQPPSRSSTGAATSPTPTGPLEPTVTPSGITTISGVVQDSGGAPVEGATVTLIPVGNFGETKGTTGPDGKFSFASVTPGSFHLSVDARGLSPFTSPLFILKPRTALELPPISLSPATTTSIQVVASPQQIALAQVHQEETQRVFGVFQNFYTSYIWDAEPIPTKQKYTLALRATFDPTEFVIVAGVAGAEQIAGMYSGYGSGLEGYGKRYGAALADQIDAHLIGSALLPALLHQDPRYFYQGSGSAASRSIHAVSFTFLARGDNGHKQINYSRLFGTLAAVGIANVYRPAADRGVSKTFESFGINLGANAAGNLFREFVLRSFESIPAFENGKVQGRRHRGER